MPETEKVTLCCGVEVEIFDGENRKDIQDAYNWSKEGFIKPVNEGWLLPKKYLEFDEKIYNFEFRETDVFIVGSPKSGTSWTQEIVWTLLNNTNLDHPNKRESVHTRVPFLEGDSLWTNFSFMKWLSENVSKAHNIPLMTHMTDMFSNIPNPRVFKSHLHYSVINQEILEKSKVIYVIRNPLDSFYSLYAFHQFLPDLYGFAVLDIRKFVDRYIKSEVWTGNALEHILSWWPYRNHKNVHIVFYENVIKDAIGEIRKLAAFIGKSLSDVELHNIVHYTSFNVMKEAAREIEKSMHISLGATPTEDRGSFFRKGEIGDSKNMPKDTYEKLVTYVNLQLKDLDLPYNFGSL